MFININIQIVLRKIKKYAIGERKFTIFVDLRQACIMHAETQRQIIKTQ
jgi:hypothetical protein